MSTIYALSSGALPAGLAVVRVSGPKTRFLLETMCGRLPDPRVASLTTIRNRTGVVLDRGLVLWFPGPRSHTGEDMAEFHVHGGRAVVRGLADALGDFDGVREAEPGEFSRRAFVGGKIDLTEAEGLADLIAAETEAQRRQALEESAGRSARLYENWRERLVRARALIEADLDFTDEEDVPGSVVEEARAEVETLAEAIDGHLADGRRGERLRDGFQVVLMGAPNAGKSTLLNRLARRDVAIVSAEAGTTRDLVEVHLDLSGYPVTIVDTAGLRDVGGMVEREGIRRALDRGGRADLVIWLDDGTTAGAIAPTFDSVPIWRVASKCDSAPPALGPGAEPRHRISAETGEGMTGFVADLEATVAADLGGGGRIGPTRERQRRILERASSALRAAAERTMPVELMAEQLRRAGDELGRLTGRIDAEELLDVIFGSFCIGK